jgi:hypothetical protein
MQANRQRFRLPWRCSGTTRGASPNGAHPGLHLKPLDAASVECLRRIALAAAMVNELEQNTQNTNKTQLLASNYGTF